MINTTSALTADSKRIIVVEDDRDFRESLVEYLVLSGFDVTGVESALEFYQCISRQKYLLVILDIGLPDQNGLVIAEYVRNNTDMRIIMLTAQSGLEKRISAFQSGADIYLSKPVDFTELSASLYSILGRVDKTISIPQEPKKNLPAFQQEAKPWILRSDWTLYTPKGDEIKLTSKEFDLLQKLALAPETVVTRKNLLSTLDYKDNELGNRSLDALIHRLRCKKKQYNYGIPVKTSHSLGYSFSAPIVIA